MKTKTFILICLLLEYFTSSARILRVGRHQQESSIQQAINKAFAGDTVWIESGFYREKNILVNKPITIIGDRYPVIDGEYHYQIISVKASGVTIKGLKLIHSGISSLEDIAAVKLYSVHDVVITDNIVEGAFFGIWAQGSSNCEIENNVLKGSSQTEQQSGNGIHCWKCDTMRIIHNKVSGHRDGIYFEFVTNSLIWRNISEHNIRYGLHFMFSHDDSYISNIFSDNGAGVSVMFTHGVRMLNNFFENNWGDGAFGILLKEISDSYIIGNKFTNNTSGIFMEGTTRIQVEKNEFRGNGWAMKIQASCMDINVADNNFLSNTFDVGTNGTLVLNTFDHNYWDKYEGYDLNKDSIGDVPFHPVSLFSVIVEKNPSSMMLFRSFMTSLLDKTERILPSLIPENLKDNYPYMKPLKL